MTKDNAVDTRLYDVRNVERNIKRGLLTRKDYEKYLKSLADSKEKGTTMGEAKGSSSDD